MISLVCSMPGEAELRRKEICLLMMISSSFLKGGLEIATKIRGIWMQQLDLQNTNKNQWVDDLILINIWRAGDSIICGSTANTCSALVFRVMLHKWCLKCSVSSAVAVILWPIDMFPVYIICYNLFFITIWGSTASTCCALVFKVMLYKYYTKTWRFICCCIHFVNHWIVFHPI